MPHVRGQLRVRIASLAVVVGVSAACGAPAPTPTAAETSPQTPPPVSAQATATIRCINLSESRCRAATDATLSVLRGEGATPANITLQPGIWYPEPGMMCNDSTCPAWEAPRADGGRYIANALVGYVGSYDSGLFNIYTKDRTVTAVFIARVPHAPEGSQPDPGPS